MKITSRQVGLVLVVGAGLLWVQAPRLGAQPIPETGGSSAEVHDRQLVAERDTLVAMLDDGNTSDAVKGAIRRLLDWNTRGLTIAEVKRMQTQPLPVKTAPPPAAATNLTNTVAAPSPGNVSSNNAPVVQNAPMNHADGTTSAAASSLDSIKARLEMNSAAHVSEAKTSEAKPLRNKPGAVVLTLRPQDSASAASQQVASVISSMTGDNHKQSVPQGAPVAAPAADRGAVSAIANATVKPIVGGTLPSASGNAGKPVLNTAVLDVGMDDSDMSAFKSTSRRYVPAANELVPRPTAPLASAPAPRPVPDELSKAAKKMRSETVTPEQRMAPPQKQPAVDVPRSGGVANVTEEPKIWVQICPLHGKYFGKGDMTPCPRCERISTRPGTGLVR